jgi:hypothetical protein
MVWGQDQDQELLAFYKDLIQKRKAASGCSNKRPDALKVEIRP